jgi:hypothetical protein
LRERTPAYRPADRITLMKRSYVRVVVVWALTLVALYALQEYFA